MTASMTISSSSSSSSSSLPPVDAHLVSLAVGANLTQYRCQIQAMPPQMQAAIRELGPQVTSLDISGHHITTKDLRDIATYFPGLQKIDLSGTHLDGYLIGDSRLIQTTFFKTHRGLKITHSILCPRPPFSSHTSTPEHILYSALVQGDGDIIKLPSSVMKRVSDVALQVRTVNVSGFELTSENLKAIARLCCRMTKIKAIGSKLDGVPIVSKSALLAIIQSTPTQKIEVVIEDETKESVTKTEENLVTQFQSLSLSSTRAKTDTATSSSSSSSSSSSLRGRAIPVKEQASEEITLTIQSFPLPLHVIIRVISRLQPVPMSHLQFNTDLRLNCRDIVNFLSVNKQFLKYLMVFSNACRVLSPRGVLWQIKDQSSIEQRFVAALDILESRGAHTLDLCACVSAKELPNWAKIVRTRYPNLQTLRLPFQVSLTDSLGKELAQLPHLTGLDIGYCDKRDLSGLKHLTRLQWLCCERPYEKTARIFMKDKAEREQLNIEKSSLPPKKLIDEDALQQFDPRTLEYIALMKQLRVLRFGAVKNLGDRALSRLSSLSKLEEFSISSPIITQKTILYLKSSKETLRKIDFRNCPLLQDPALKDIINNFPTLTGVYLGDNGFSHYLFEALKSLNNLTHLVLGSFDRIPTTLWNRLPIAAPGLTHLILENGQHLTNDVLLSWRTFRHLTLCKIYSNGASYLSDEAQYQFQMAHPECYYSSQLRMPLGPELQSPEEFLAQEFAKGFTTEELERKTKNDSEESEEALRAYARLRLRKKTAPNTGPTEVSTKPIDVLFPSKVVAIMVSYIASPTLFFKQTNLHLQSHGLLQKFVSFVGDSDTQQLFVKAMQNIRPLIALSKPQETPEDEALFTQEMASSIRTLDIRAMATSLCTTAIPKMNHRYPNLTTLLLPVCTLTQELGLSIANMPHVDTLDLTFCDISDPASLTYLPTHLKGLYYQGVSGESDRLLGNTRENSGKVDRQALPLDFEKELEKRTSCVDAHVTNIARFTQLEILDLGKVPGITDTGIRALAPLSRLQLLSVVGGKTLGDDSFELITRQFPQLREFHCGFNKITDRGMEHLTRLEHLETLVVGLQGNLTATGWGSIARCTRLRRLLVAQSPGLTEEILCTYAGLPGLEVIHVLSVSPSLTSSFIFPKKAKKEFERRLPHCRILVDNADIRNFDMDSVILLI